MKEKASSIIEKIVNLSKTDLSAEEQLNILAEDVEVSKKEPLYKDPIRERVLKFVVEECSIYNQHVSSIFLLEYLTNTINMRLTVSSDWSAVGYEVAKYLFEDILQYNVMYNVSGEEMAQKLAKELSK